MSIYVHDGLGGAVQIVILDLDTGMCTYFQQDLFAIPHKPLRTLEHALEASLLRYGAEYQRVLQVPVWKK